MEQKEFILRTLVGSQAHGLANEDSDYDYRGVFVIPTEEILALGRSIKQTDWIEGKNDDTSWEIGHFLNLATKCNPTILEVFLSPVIDETEEGKRLRELFPYVWNSQYVRDAFIGYAHNQRKKMLEDKDKRSHKYAAAYLRVLYQAHQLLKTGTFNVRIADEPIGRFIREVKDKDSNVKIGTIIDACYALEVKVHDAYEENFDKKTDVEKINEFLLEVRKSHWRY